ncbi:unnamed protein product [Ixodes pacificus]
MLWIYIYRERETTNLLMGSFMRVWPNNSVLFLCLYLSLLLR